MMNIKVFAVLVLSAWTLSATAGNAIDNLKMACPNCYEAALETALEKGLELKDDNLKSILDSETFQSKLKPKAAEAYRKLYCASNDCAKS